MSSPSNCHKWTLDELDLQKPLVQLSSLIHDKQRLMEALFTIVSTREIRKMMPDNLKHMPIDILKDICIIEMKDNQIIDDETISSMLQPPGDCESKSNEATIASESMAVVSTNETSESALENNSAPGKEDPVKDSPQAELKNDPFTLVDQRMKQSLHEKTGLPLEDLDLGKAMVHLHDKRNQRSELLELMFSILTSDEIDQLIPLQLKADKDQVKVKCLRVLNEMTEQELNSILGPSDRSSTVPVCGSSGRSDIVKDDESGERKDQKKERKHERNRQKEGDSVAPDAVEIKDAAMDEDRNRETTMQKRMDGRMRITGADGEEQEAVYENRDVERRLHDVVLNRKTHPAKDQNEGKDKVEEDDQSFNEKSNERWMNFCPRETQKEIEELEKRAQILRRMLQGLDRDSSHQKHRRKDKNRETAKTSSSEQSAGHKNTRSSLTRGTQNEPDFLCFEERMDGDEDELDRELRGDDE